MADELGIRLTAQVTEWVTNLQKAAKAADGLLISVREVERGIKAAFAGIEAAAKGSASVGAAFASAAAQFDKSAAKIEGDAKGASKALDGLASTADRSAKSVSKSASAMGSAAGSIGRSAAESGRLTNSALGDVEAAFGKVSGRITSGVANMRNAVLALGAVRFGQAAVESASEFEAAIGQVSIVAADSGKDIAELRGFLLDLSKTTPIGLVDLTKSLGDAIGKLPKGANQAALAIDALGAAQAAARASGSSAGQVLDGIIPILNTYGKTGITAAEITDKLFAAFDQGGATVPELSASLGQIVGISSQFGISIDELLGSIAVLTRGGQTASEAITNLRQALISTARPPKIVKDELEALGISADLFSAQSLKSNGLIGVLKQLQAKGGESKLEKLYTDTQGFLGVATLLGAGLSQVDEDITLIGQAAGKTDAAVGKIAQNFDQLAGIAKNRLGAAMIEIGERIMPTVARVLGQLADYAEKNGAAIADGIGRAVEALARIGEWVAEYGPTILTWFVAFKAASFFAGLTKDIAGVVVSLSNLNKGFAASQALGDGLSSLGAKAGGSFTKGFGGALKGLGGTLKAAFSSPGIIGAAVAAGTIGYTIGTELMEQLGEAIYEGQNRIVMVRIAELEREIAQRLKTLGVNTVDEAADIGTKIRRGEVVRGVDGRSQTLAEVQQQAPGAVEPAFRQAMKENAAEVSIAQAAVAKSAALMAEAAANVEGLKRALRNDAEIAEAEKAHQEYQAVVAARAQRVAELTAGGAKLTADYVAIVNAAEAAAKAEADAANGAKKAKAAGARSGEGATAKAAKEEASELEQIAKDVIAFYERENAVIAALGDKRLEASRLAAEAAQNEADARRAAFEAETDAKLGAMQAADVAEAQIAATRADREAGLAGIIDAQIDAMGKVARVRIEEAQVAAQKETDAYRDNAEMQLAIAQNLATQEAIIQADLAARTEEIRSASSVRIEAANLAALRARLAEASKLAQAAADVAPETTIQGRAKTLAAGLSDSGAGSQMLQGIGGQLGGLSGGALGAIGGGIPVIGELNMAAKAIGGLFGGDVEGLQKKARKKEAEAADIEKQLAKGGQSPEEKKALEERLAGLRKESEELRNAAEAARGGLETFFLDFMDNIDAAIIGIIEGLPQAIDRILTVALPAFIERLVGSLPQIIGGLIALLPRIAWSLAKAIGYVLPVALYEGVVKAGEAMIEFFTTGVVADIGVGIKDAFMAVVDGITAVFEPIIEFFRETVGLGGSTGEDVGTGVGAIAGGIAGGLLGGPGGAVVGAAAGAYLGDKVGGFVNDLFHQGGIVGSGSSNPHAAAAMAMAGAPQFANGGMVTGIGSLARRRLSQVLGGDDVPALLAPGEGVLTARGVAAAGGPTGVESFNRGNPGAATGAQIVLSARVGGDAALAAMISRIVAVSVRSPSGAVRMAVDQANRGTRVPGYAGLKPFPT